MISAARLDRLARDARAGAVDSQEIFVALKHFNENIRVSWIDDPDATPLYFEALSVCMELDDHEMDIRGLVVRTVSCLVRRVVSQDREEDLVRSAPVILPILIGSLSFAESNPSQKDVEQGIEAMWFVCAEPTEQALREIGLESRSASVRCSTLHLLGDHIGGFSFRKFTPCVCRLLLDPDTNTHNAAYALLVHFFSGASDKARADLRRYLERLQIPEAISTRILAKVNHVASPEPKLPSAGTAERLTTSSTSSTSKTQLSAPVMSIDDLAVLKDPKYSPQQGISPAPCEDDDSLLSIVESMHRTFEGKENEQNWNQREAALKRLRQLLRSPNLTGNGWRKAMHRLQTGMCKALLSLRTTLSMTACHTVKEAFQLFGSDLDALAEIYVNDLTKVCASPKKITSQFAHVCVSAILLNVSYQTKLLHFVCRTPTESKAQVRPFAMDWLKTIAVIHGVNMQAGLPKQLSAEIEKVLTRGLTDALPETRVASRGAFWAISSVYHAFIDRIMPRLDPATRKAVTSAAPKSKGPILTASSSKSRSPTPALQPSSTPPRPVEENVDEDETPERHRPEPSPSPKLRTMESPASRHNSTTPPNLGNRNRHAMSHVQPHSIVRKSLSPASEKATSQMESPVNHNDTASVQNPEKNDQNDSVDVQSHSSILSGASFSHSPEKSASQQESFDILMSKAKAQVHVYGDSDDLSHMAVHKALTSRENSELLSDLVRSENVGRVLHYSSPGVICSAISAASFSDEEKRMSLERLMHELNGDSCGSEVAVAILEELCGKSRLQPLHVRNLGKLLMLLPTFSPSRKILEFADKLVDNEDVQNWVKSLQHKAQDVPDISKINISPVTASPKIDRSGTPSDWSSRPNTSSVFSWSAGESTDNVQMIGQLPTNQVECLVFFEGLVKSVERRTASDKTLALLAMFVGGRRVLPEGGGGSTTLALRTWSQAATFQNRLSASIINFVLDPMIDDAKVAVALVVVIELATCDSFAGREESLLEALVAISEQKSESLLLRCRLIPEVIRAISAAADAEVLGYAAIKLLPTATLYSSKVMLERLLSSLVPNLSSEVVAAIARIIPRQMDDSDARVRKEAYPLLMAVFERNKEEADLIQENLTGGQRRLIQYYLQC